MRVMPRLSLSLFGGFHATLDGQALTDFRTQKVPALLAYLAVESARPHTRERLAGLLWPDLPEDAARDNLRGTLYQLRRTLPEQDDAQAFFLLTRETVQFNPASDYWLDVTEFMRLLTTTQTHRHYQLAACPHCMKLHAQASALYHGDFLHGVFTAESEPFAEWLLLKREPLRAHVLLLLHQLTNYHLQRRHYAVAEHYARQQLTLASWEETAHRQLMRILALTDRRAAALAQYAACQRTLQAELGVEPETETTTLYQQIRDGNPQTTLQPANYAATSKSPIPIFNLQSSISNLPAPLTSLIGRETEQAELLERLSTMDCRLLTLVGTGGVGKTRLAVEVAAQLADEFPHGVWFVDLAPVVEATLIPHVVASALGVREEATQSLMLTLNHYLRDKALLLVLDNCEHLIEACAVLAESLLQASPQLKVLATSRESLRCDGEQVYPVPSLAQPDPTQLPPLTALTQYPAVRLFSERAYAAGAIFTVGAHNAQAIAHICWQLDGIPLALELAAAQTSAFSVIEIAERLVDRFRLLTKGKRTALPRQQTLRALVDWSYDLLTTEERRLWQRLSVFAGGWTLAAAEAICGYEPVPVTAIPALLSQLANKSLIVSETPKRYRLLETLRQYGQERLQQTGEATVVSEKHLQFYWQLAEAAEPHLTGAEQPLWLQQLEVEHGNIQAALAWSIKSGSREAGVRLAGALGRFWRMRGYFSESRHWLDGVLASNTEVSKAARAKALNWAGRLAEMQGARERAQTLLQESLTLRRELGDGLGMAETLNNLASIAWTQDEHESARALFEESLALRRDLGDQWGTASTLNNLGAVAHSQGDYTRAQRLCTESLALRRELNDQWGIAYCLNNLGLVASAQKDYKRVRELHAESLSLRHALGDQWAMAHNLVGLAEVAWAEGDATLATRLLGAVAALLQSTGAVLERGFRAMYERAITALRKQLAEATFAQAWAEGQNLTLAQAIELALKQS
jgi:predicted ATPase/DNA-binding SARP family transcriptional activator